ncbi:MAG: alpha/beta hydrolase [Gammaproteobacteria bacterium]|nr:alpha/beta hydrolase [Gammaproteobacteria bacterium]
MISISRRSASLYLILIIALFSGACSRLDVLNATAGSSGYRRVADQAYGSAPRQKLDIYIPTDKTANTDVVIFFYGGRWQTGDKNDYRFAAAGLTANGVISVIPDYRLYPQVDWRDFIGDAAAAYRWVEKNIAAHGGNPRRIFLMGHSAGAHITAMVALDQSLRRQAGSEINPCGMIGLAGPYDFLPFADADVKQVFHSAERALETQPVFYADRTDPNILLLTGDADTSVKPRNTYRLAQTLQDRGGKAQVIVYKGVGHAEILIALAPRLKFIAPVLSDALNFIRKTECEP